MILATQTCETVAHLDMYHVAGGDSDILARGGCVLRFGSGWMCITVSCFCHRRLDFD